ncbi:MarR family winged helix-turn-helix transcriptional regulator [Anaerofustis sp. NSJ-163]|uniref:MarR family winged helix-turn-helix transcriptional regulator n=1 Tax=Anaerofustis sp. NSJ-163 TaxID=2944391 RepID=UPI00209BF758|nr:MarR family transcriptional regulator [Anaerofustis sp. NSJ-163]MCO8194772.1 MarR family transcriptional regulator [Anaerofustis sp. NSJ-163]
MFLNKNCAKYDLTAPQAVIILIICDFEKITQDEITKKIGLDKSVVAKTLNKMEERGFVERTTNIKDKRKYDIKPTNKALEVYPFVKEQVKICFDRMTDKMTKEEKNEFKKLLLLAANSTISMDE